MPDYFNDAARYRRGYQQGLLGGEMMEDYDRVTLEGFREGQIAGEQNERRARGLPPLSDEELAPRRGRPLFSVAEAKDPNVPSGRIAPPPGPMETLLEPLMSEAGRKERSPGLAEQMFPGLEAGMAGRAEAEALAQQRFPIQGEADPRYAASQAAQAPIVKPFQGYEEARSRALVPAAEWAFPSAGEQVVTGAELFGFPAAGQLGRAAALEATRLAPALKGGAQAVGKALTTPYPRGIASTMGKEAGAARLPFPEMPGGVPPETRAILEGAATKKDRLAAIGKRLEEIDKATVGATTPEAYSALDKERMALRKYAKTVRKEPVRPPRETPPPIPQAEQPPPVPVKAPERPPVAPVSPAEPPPIPREAPPPQVPPEGVIKPPVKAPKSPANAPVRTVAEGEVRPPPIPDDQPPAVPLKSPFHEPAMAKFRKGAEGYRKDAVLEIDHYIESVDDLVWQREIRKGVTDENLIAKIANEEKINLRRDWNRIKKGIKADTPQSNALYRSLEDQAAFDEMPAYFKEMSVKTREFLDQFPRRFGLNRLENYAPRHLWDRSANRAIKAVQQTPDVPPPYPVAKGFERIPSLAEDIPAKRSLLQRLTGKPGTPQTLEDVIGKRVELPLDAPPIEQLDEVLSMGKWRGPMAFTPAVHANERAAQLIGNANYVQEEARAFWLSRVDEMGGAAVNSLSRVEQRRLGLALGKDATPAQIAALSPEAKAIHDRLAPFIRETGEGIGYEFDFLELALTSEGKRKQTHLLNNAIQEYANRAAKMAYKNPVANDIIQWVKSQQLKGAMLPQEAHYWGTTIDDWQGVASGAARAFAGVSDPLSRLYMAGKLFGSLKTAALQWTALLPVMIEHAGNPGAVVKGLQWVGSKQNRRVLRDLQNIGTFEKHFFRPPDLAPSRGLVGRVRRRVEEIGSVPMRWSDRTPRQIGALTAYYDAIGKGATHPQALNKAAREVMQFQAAYGQGLVPPVLANPWTKPFFIFMTYPINYWNRVMHHLNQGIVGKRGGSLAKAGALVALPAWMLSKAYGTAFGSSWLEKTWNALQLPTVPGQPGGGMTGAAASIIETIDAAISDPAFQAKVKQNPANFLDILAEFNPLGGQRAFRVTRGLVEGRQPHGKFEYTSPTAKEPEEYTGLQMLFRAVGFSPYGGWSGAMFPEQQQLLRQKDAAAKGYKQEQASRLQMDEHRRAARRGEEGIKEGLGAQLSTARYMPLSPGGMERMGGQMAQSAQRDQLLAMVDPRVRQIVNVAQPAFAHMLKTDKAVVSGAYQTLKAELSKAQAAGDEKRIAAYQYAMEQFQKKYVAATLLQKLRGVGSMLRP